MFIKHYPQNKYCTARLGCIFHMNYFLLIRFKAADLSLLSLMYLKKEFPQKNGSLTKLSAAHKPIDSLAFFTPIFHAKGVLQAKPG